MIATIVASLTKRTMTAMPITTEDNAMAGDIKQLGVELWRIFSPLKGKIAAALLAGLLISLLRRLFF